MKGNYYYQIIEWVFLENYEDGSDTVPFDREDFDRASDELRLPRIKNLGDIVYSFRYRRPLPEAITSLAPTNKEWIIRGAGRSKYVFALVDMVRIRPNESLCTIKIPNSTPEIINASALGDEQALLALVRYNRLIDLFLGFTAYSLQNHLRTTASGIGQVEIDEIYVAVDKYGQEYVIPVQAKAHNDEIGVTQPEQDLAVCAEKWPEMTAMPVAVQFMEDGVVALFLLTMQDGQIRVAREAHYRLVPYDQISEDDKRLYKTLAAGEAQ